MEEETATFNPIENEELFFSLIDHKPNDYQLIVFLQDAATKKVYQAKAFPLSIITSDLESLSADQSLRVFPNPASEKLIISLPKHFREEVVIKIMDLQGRVIVDQLYKSDHFINIKYLPEGFYTISIFYDSHKTSVNKIIIKK
ncbi:MAG: T9SS type A sorting domain-containing protein [Bacteroidota bacterium]